MGLALKNMGHSKKLKIGTQIVATAAKRIQDREMIALQGMIR